MRKKLIALFVIALCLGGFSTLAYADNIGFVDMQKILMSSSEAKKAQDELQKKQADFQKDYEEKIAQIDKAKADKKTDEEIKKIIDKLEKELEPKKQELMKLNQDLTNKVKTKILGAATKVAKEYGIDVILDKQVVLTGGFDLTDFVIEKLNSSK
jgi:outer membrane protein